MDNSFRRQHTHTNKWSAHLAGFGSPEEQFYRYSNLFVDQLCQTHFEDFGKLELMEKLFGFLQIHHVTPLGYSQQLEAQQSLPKSFTLKDAEDAVSF